MGLFLECHERIRTFCTLAVDVGRHVEASDEETQVACDRFIRYFSEALPLHVIDEEKSLLPRLLTRSQKLRPELERMQLQHECHQPLIDRVLFLGKGVRQAPSDRELRRHLLVESTHLQEELNEHLLMEEELLFPKISEVLSLAEQEAILQEMRSRRQELQDVRAPRNRPQEGGDLTALQEGSGSRHADDSEVSK